MLSTAAIRGNLATQRLRQLVAGLSRSATSLPKYFGGVAVPGSSGRIGLLSGLEAGQWTRSHQ
jgi:hypothetical protein